MALIKTVFTGGDWGYKASHGDPLAQLIKRSSRGLIGNDRAGLIKRAGYEFADQLDKLNLLPGDVPIHEIALGAWEAIGFNRNGDGFKEAECRQSHPTFVKFARSYRNHKNRNPEVSFGRVKLSHYNEDMRRIELITVLNGTKEAAERNGGLIADRELEKLERGEDLPRSMSCKVSHDVCAACGNRARNRSEYCEAKEAGGSCTRMGCASNLTKMAQDGFMQGVYNPNCVWFDQSMVGRNADPTAWGAKAEWLTKAASGEAGVGGAELSEGLGLVAPLSVVLYGEMPIGIWEQFVSEQVKMAHGLAVIESRLANGSVPAAQLRGVALAAQTPVNLTPLGEVGSSKMASALGALAREQAILPLPAFATLTGRQAAAKAAALAVPGIYTRLIADGSLQTRVENNQYAPSWNLSSVACRAWAKTAGCSLRPDKLEEESYRSRIRQLPAPQFSICANVKLASSREAQTLAADYAIYKLSALHRMLEVPTQFLAVAEAAVGMDYVT